MFCQTFFKVRYLLWCGVFVVIALGFVSLVVVGFLVGFVFLLKGPSGKIVEKNVNGVSPSINSYINS